MKVTARQLARIGMIFWAIGVAAVVCGSLLPPWALHRLHYDSVAPNDKVVHFLGYTVLAVLPVAFMEIVGVGVAFAAGMIPMGICLEFLQRMVPGRSFEVRDMIANSLGVVAGILVALSLRPVVRDNAA